MSSDFSGRDVRQSALDAVCLLRDGDYPSRQFLHVMFSQFIMRSDEPAVVEFYGSCVDEFFGNGDFGED